MPRVLTVLALTAAAVFGLSCVPTDVPGCPLEPADAIGLPCGEVGTQCGEFGLCDPCGDVSACEAIECAADGTWQVVDLGACADGGAG